MLPVQGSGGRDNRGRGILISEFRKSSGVRKAPELFEFFSRWFFPMAVNGTGAVVSGNMSGTRAGIRSSVRARSALHP